ncbi:type II toxin-antitoxin system HicA family toxin [Phyllobacterium sp. 628]|nr:type II toxin-antitoxin system HicA family toxin [Phyllobacterium sp. 628]QND54141.1 type II toxin-antitoxin system HicA family toxin [Phyllobacterium sp. 628]
MKREALLRELRDIARRLEMTFEVVENRGKGSHYRVRLGDRFTTVKSGELTPGYVRLIRKQLGVG